MNTTTVKNNAPHPKTIAWTRHEDPRPSVLNPRHYDVIRGDHGAHTVAQKVTIGPGASGQVPSDVLAELRESDPAVRHWFASGELVEVA